MFSSDSFSPFKNQARVTLFRLVQENIIQKTKFIKKKKKLYILTFFPYRSTYQLQSELLLAHGASKSKLYIYIATMYACQWVVRDLLGHDFQLKRSRRDSQRDSQRINSIRLSSYSSFTVEAALKLGASATFSNRKLTGGKKKDILIPCYFCF